MKKHYVKKEYYYHELFLNNKLNSWFWSPHKTIIIFLDFLTSSFVRCLLFFVNAHLRDEQYFNSIRRFR